MQSENSPPDVTKSHKSGPAWETFGPDVPSPHSSHKHLVSRVGGSATTTHNNTRHTNPRKQLNSGMKRHCTHLKKENYLEPGRFGKDSLAWRTTCSGTQTDPSSSRKYKSIRLVGYEWSPLTESTSLTSRFFRTDASALQRRIQQSRFKSKRAVREPTEQSDKKKIHFIIWSLTFYRKETRWSGALSPFKRKLTDLRISLFDSPHLSQKTSKLFFLWKSHLSLSYKGQHTLLWPSRPRGGENSGPNGSDQTNRKQISHQTGSTCQSSLKKLIWCQ